VIAFYDRASNSRKTVKCQILDELTPITEAEDKILAAHIWKVSTRGKGLEEFGLLPEEINNARNGMFLTKGIEDAFDKQQVCFLYNVLESSLILWVADHAILSATIIGSTKKFSDVHQKPCSALMVDCRTGDSFHGTHGSHWNCGKRHYKV
jgi:hypothetical protein